MSVMKKESIEQNKADHKYVHLNRPIRENVIEKVTFELRAEGGVGVRHVDNPVSQPQYY